MEKLLTIVIPARNDDYKTNYKKDYQTRLIIFQKKTNELKFSDLMEITIVDWNSENPLQDHLFLIEEAIKICKFINVKPNLASKKMKPGKVFNLPCTINTGIRKGRI